MKKTLALILCAAMLLSFVACSSKKEEVKTPANETAEDVVKETEEPEEVTDGGISRGTIDGNTYSSRYSDIMFTKPDSWTYSSDEELAELINTSIEALDINSFAKTIAEMGTVYDMMALDPATGSNVLVMYEDLDVTNGGKSVTEGEYLSILEKQLVEQAGYKAIGSGVTSVCGNKYLTGEFSLTMNDMEISQHYYLRIMDDNIMHALIVTLINGTAIEEVEAMFEA